MVKRQGNWLGSMRVDAPHLRLIESSVAGDFQSLAGTLMSGTRALVASGLTISDTGMVGQPAQNLYLTVSNGVLLHGTASEAGAIYTIDNGTPAQQLVGTNPNVSGSFAPSATNYISIDLIRATDATTADNVIFRDASTGLEFSQVVPLARVLGYKIYISTTSFPSTPTRAPIAIVTTDTAGAVVTIVDCRQLFFRLGTGGSTPSPLAPYTWASRTETATTGSGVFAGGDKGITSQYDFNRAIMSRLWELSGGGEHWYSDVQDRYHKLVGNPAAVFISSGDNFEWVSSNLHWQGLRIILSNSTAAYNYVNDQTGNSSGLTNLADGECIYVDINPYVNGTALTAVKAAQASLGSPTIPGTRFILAWRHDIGGTPYLYTNHSPTFRIGNTGSIPQASPSVYGVVQLSSAGPGTAVVPPTDGSGRVLAVGLTRGVSGGLGAGTLAIGTGGNDTAITVATGSVTTTVAGPLVASSTLNVTGVTTSGSYTTSGAYTRSAYVQRRNFYGGPFFVQGGSLVSAATLYPAAGSLNTGTVSYEVYSGLHVPKSARFNTWGGSFIRIEAENSDASARTVTVSIWTYDVSSLTSYTGSVSLAAGATRGLYTVTGFTLPSAVIGDSVMIGMTVVTPSTTSAGQVKVYGVLYSYEYQTEDSEA